MKVNDLHDIIVYYVRVNQDKEVNMKCKNFTDFVRRFEKVSDLIARLDGYRDVLRLDGLYETLTQLIEDNPGFWEKYFWKETGG